MNAPLRLPPPTGSPSELREFIAEMASMARIQADLVATYASIGDDAGLRYAVRRLAAYTRAAIATAADLDELQQRRASQ